MCIFCILQAFSILHIGHILHILHIVHICLHIRFLHGTACSALPDETRVNVTVVQRPNMSTAALDRRPAQRVRGSIHILHTQHILHILHIVAISNRALPRGKARFEISKNSYILHIFKKLQYKKGGSIFCICVGILWHIGHILHILHISNMSTAALDCRPAQRVRGSIHILHTQHILHILHIVEISNCILHIVGTLINVWSFFPIKMEIWFCKLLLLFKIHTMTDSGMQYHDCAYVSVLEEF